MESLVDDVVEHAHILHEVLAGGSVIGVLSDHFQEMACAFLARIKLAAR